MRLVGCLALGLAAVMAGCAAPDLSGNNMSTPVVSTRAGMSSANLSVSTLSSTSAQRAGDPGTSATVNAPHAHPPLTPCTMPPPDLAQSVASAAAIIDVLAPRTFTKSVARTPSGQPDPNPYEYRLIGAKSLKPATASSSTYTLDAPAPLDGGSEYILFLGGAQATGFFLNDGFEGAFLIERGYVSFKCPNYEDPVHPLHSSGSEISASAFRRMILAAG
ncbi:hypothetical protein [Nakamurella sp. UYEF19]|uniref:hypothetical protein n=1 Tax=Nakamurella sp. UYEF19 TaxID=1756392 RepID=UPI0033972FBA